MASWGMTRLEGAEKIGLHEVGSLCHHVVAVLSDLQGRRRFLGGARVLPPRPMMAVWPTQFIDWAH